MWGVLLFILIAFEKAVWKNVFERYKVIGHIYMLVVIPFSWAVFAHSEISQMICFFKRLFQIGVTSGYVYSGDYVKYGKEYGIVLLLSLFFTTRVPQKLWKRIKNTYTGQFILIDIFVGAVYCLYIGLNNPFLYYQF